MSAWRHLPCLGTPELGLAVHALASKARSTWQHLLLTLGTGKKLAWAGCYYSVRSVCKRLLSLGTGKNCDWHRIINRLAYKAVNVPASLALTGASRSAHCAGHAPGRGRIWGRAQQGGGRRPHLRGPAVQGGASCRFCSSPGGRYQLLMDSMLVAYCPKEGFCAWPAALRLAESCYLLKDTILYRKMIHEKTSGLHLCKQHLRCLLWH